MKRNLLLRDFFSDQDSDYNPKDLKKLFKPKSTWVPKSEHISDQTKTLISALDLKTRSTLKKYNSIDGIFLTKKIKDNLSIDQRLAIKSLKNNRNIIIKPADKGGKICILNLQNYINEGERQLKNKKYYTEIEEAPKKLTCTQINKILYSIYKQKIIDQKQYSYLAAKTSDANRSFYLLPKVHKPPDKWPNPKMPEGRPIVGDCGTEARRVSEFITYYIAPLAKKHRSYIKDTYHFLEKIRGCSLGSNSLLVTGDITALYTNMDTDRTIRSVAKLFQENPQPHRPDREILQLLKLTLSNNFFRFNGKTYLQTLGMGMGKTYAPNCADIYMLEFDEGAMVGFYLKPIHYYRFLDDIFFEWTGTIEQLLEYQNFLNTLLPNIKITLNWHHERVNFLDTTVFRHIDKHTHEHSMQTKVFFKETDTHQLLHTSSFHPKHTTIGILKSQLLRFKRISSFKHDYNNTCLILFHVLKQRGYNYNNLRRWQKRIWKGPITNKANSGNILPIVLPFSPISTDFYSVWRETLNQHGFDNISRPLAAYKKQKNLGNLLTSSRLQVDKDNRTTLNSTLFNIDWSTEIEEGACG